MPKWEQEIRQRLSKSGLSPARENAVIEELSQYLDDCYDELRASGVSESEAYRRTLAELSGSETLQRELRRVERQVPLEPVALGTNRRTNMIADLWQDLRYGARMLLKQPGGALIPVLTLALGIGANTAIFSVINGVLLRPLPYKNTDLLVVLWTDDPRHDLHEALTSYSNFEDWKKTSRLFEDMAVLSRPAPMNLMGADETQRIVGERVSPSLFSVLGVQPLLGRSFSFDEAERRERVVVLSHRLWLRQFGGAADVIGKTLEIDGKSSQVIG